MLCGSLDGREVWGSIDTSVCRVEAFCCLLETTITLLICYTPIQKVKKKKKKETTFTHAVLKCKQLVPKEHGGLLSHRTPCLDRTRNEESYQGGAVTSARIVIKGGMESRE